MSEYKPLFSRSTGRSSTQRVQSVQNPASQTADLVSLQRVIGNQAMQRLMASGNLPAALGIQAKLHVGAANDGFEQEADKVASQVMSMSEAPVQREAADDELAMKRVGVIQRESEEDESESIAMKRVDVVQREAADDEELAMKRADIQREEVDMMGAFEVGGGIERKIEQTAGSGQSLPESTRNFLEPRFGQDFSNVNVHADSEADSLNRSMQARAFTKGSDIYFASGEYQPDSNGGRALLSHELTHVIQQTGGNPS